MVERREVTYPLPKLVPGLNARIPDSQSPALTIRLCLCYEESCRVLAALLAAVTNTA